MVSHGFMLGRGTIRRASPGSAVAWCRAPSIPRDEKPGEKRTSGPNAVLGRMDAQCEATDLLIESTAGDRQALDRLMPLVYDQLRRIAHRELRRSRPDQTLSTTEVVHEAYLRLVDQSRVARAERAQFLAVAAIAMRRIVIEYWRRNRAQKRGGGERPLSLDDSAMAIAVGDPSELLPALDEALTRLAALNERLARVVECRYFAGLTEQETADVLSVTARTVRRDWEKARAWLYAELYGSAA
jgi:RNA polymerase sigma factor (TIGR02999 family)